MSQVRFGKLLEPCAIGTMQVKNRVVMPPMGTWFATDGGFVSQRLIDYHEARAKGGVGLIIIEVTTPSLKCQSPGQLTLGADGYIPGFRRLADTVHQYGTRIVVQLQHSGIEARGGQRIQVAPSPVIVPSTLNVPPGKVPHELTVEEIETIIQWFVSASVRAREAGLDGVEIHAAHSYLLASFLSSTSNRRNDKYGGTVENKARFMTETLQEIRKKVGVDYPVWPRINALEWGRENGITIDETRKVVQLAEKAGASAINVSGLGVGHYITTCPITDTPGILLPAAAEVKKVVHVPVIVAGRLDAELGEKALQEGQADFIAIGRRIYAEPEYVNKVTANKLDDINYCIGCMECIERLGLSARGGVCVTNPATGREREYQIYPADKKKKVVVVGSGPAGLKAAQIAALRGHQVILMEKSSRLGGKLNIAAVPPHKEDIIPWKEYLVRQMNKNGVQVVLNTTATAESIAGYHPDAVIVATGSDPAVPKLTGIENANAVTAEDVLSGTANTGENVLVIGGGMVGCETAYFLAEQGKKVTVVEVLKEIAADVLPRVKRRLLDGLAKNKVTIITGAVCSTITKNSLYVAFDDKEQAVTFDTVVLAAGYKINDALFRQIEGKFSEVYCIGDAFQTRRILDATNEGYRIALSL